MVIPTYCSFQIKQCKAAPPSPIDYWCYFCKLSGRQSCWLMCLDWRKMSVWSAAYSSERTLTVYMDLQHASSRYHSLTVPLITAILTLCSCGASKFCRFRWLDCLEAWELRHLLEPVHTESAQSLNYSKFWASLVHLNWNAAFSGSVCAGGIHVCYHK